MKTFDEKVQALMRALHMSSCATMQERVALTQSAWLRPSGSERWDIKESSPEQRALLMPYFHDLSLVEAIYPQKNHYTYGLVHGSVMADFRVALRFLRTLWLRGIRFEHLVLLSGKRKLDQQQEIAVLLKEGVDYKDLPATETDMMLTEFQQADLPQDLLCLPRTVVVAPEHMLQDGSRVRPTTADTVKTWLQHNPQPGSVLAISSQPSCLYQQVVARTLLPACFSLETVADIVSPQVPVGEYLDSLARILYQAYISGYQEIDPLVP